MEPKNNSKQVGTCVDPLWDEFPSDLVTHEERRSSRSSGDAVPGKSTPLTPQEFELLSNSNPFKQDIAEKYGLAYPGITTRSQSKDVLNKSRYALELDSGDGDEGNSRKRHNDDDDSGEGFGCRKTAKDDGQSVFVALSQFLLRNRQSIDESIDKIDRNDGLFSNVNNRDATLQEHDERELTSEDIVEEDVKDSARSATYVDKRNEKLGNKRESTKIYVNDISTSRAPLRSDTFDVEIKEQQKQSSDSTQQSVLTETQFKDHSVIGNVANKADPYSAIRDFDSLRKFDHTKAFSEGGTQASSKDESFDIPLLSTRSLDMSESRNYVKERFHGVSNRSSAEKIKEKETGINEKSSSRGTSGGIPGRESETGLENSQRETIHKDETNVEFSETSEKLETFFINFDDNFSDFSTWSTKPHTKNELTGMANPTGSNQPIIEDRKSCLTSENQFKVSDNISDGSEGKHEHEGLDRHFSKNLSTDSWKTVRVQKVDSEELDLVRSSISSPLPELAADSVNEISRTLDTLPTSGDAKSSTYRGSKESSATNKDEITRKGDIDLFSSSFYAVFSTTVSSLEDVDEADRRQSPEDKLSTSVGDKDKLQNDKSDNESVFEVEENTQKEYVEILKDDDVWEGSQTSDQEAHEIDSSTLSEFEDHSACISKDILLQKRFQVSDDSAGSSRGSVSRDSLKVNLSQDSSTLDQFEDLPSSAVTGPPDHVIHRHFDLITQLDPLTECSSTDSIMVHVSNESLNSAGTTNTEIHGIRPEKPIRNPMFFDVRKSRIPRETRRRSLPIVKQAHVEKDELNADLVTETEDPAREGSHRRSSLPSKFVKSRVNKVSKISDGKRATYDGSSVSSTSDVTSSRVVMGKQERFKTHHLSEVTSTIPNATSDVPTDFFSNIPDAFPVSFTDLVNADTQPIVQSLAKSNEFFSSKAIPSDQPATKTENLINVGQERTADTEVIEPPGQDEDRSESPTQSDAFAEFVRSRLQQPLRAMSALSSKSPSAPSRGLEQSKDEEGETELINTSEVALVESSQKPRADVETSVSFRDKLLNIRTSKMNPQKLPARQGFLEQTSKENHNVNITIPPDLVPYEEIYSEQLQSLPEVSYENAMACVEPELKAITHTVTEDNPHALDKFTNDGVKAGYPLEPNCVEIGYEVSREKEVSEKSQEKDLEKINNGMVVDGKKELIRMEGTQKEVSEGALSAQSSSDSDGGDIDAIVQEYKQEGSESDDGNIDDIVKEFKKENLEEDNQSAGELEENKNRNSAFNKFGRVLNKMQSVTKYMSKKKGDNKEFEDKPRMSIVGLIGRQTKSHSRDEGSEDSSFKTKKAKVDNDDSLDLLSKAAEVFKEQTVRKKKMAPVNAWRSKTVRTENVEIDADSEYDLVAKAAILFKGFKGKKPGDIDFNLGKSECKKPTTELAESIEGIDQSTSQVHFESANSKSGFKSPSFLDKMEDSGTLGVQNNQQDILTLDIQNKENCEVSIEGIISSPELFKTMEVSIAVDSMSRSECLIDSDTSKLEDSGFESVAKYANEQLMRSDATETQFEDASETLFPDATETLFPNAAETLNLEASETLSDDASETPFPDATETLNFYASETMPTDATETLFPDAMEILFPDATESPFPDATETLTLNATETLFPDATDNLFADDFTGDTSASSSHANVCLMEPVNIEILNKDDVVSEEVVAVANRDEYFGWKEHSVTSEGDRANSEKNVSVIETMQDTLVNEAYMAFEASVAPDASVVSETSLTPEDSIVPEAIVAPEASVAPETIVAPKAAVAPDASVAPETFVAPDVSVATEAIVAPKAYVAPQATLVPEAIVALEASVAHEAIVAHEASLVPEAQLDTYEVKVQKCETLEEEKPKKEQKEPEISIKNPDARLVELKLQHTLPDNAIDEGNTSEFKSPSSTSDTDIEPVSPEIKGGCNEQTCDLILSTGYEEAKATKKAEAIINEKKGDKGKEATSDQREMTNGKLDEIVKEIWAMEADIKGRQLMEPKTLEVMPPGYQRLSSESAEGPDAYSMTVNFPESPDNMKMLDEDGSLSLCCGANFKINLNCTAMMKKPERRPSAVVVSDKRCAMTEEEKMFPLKVSATCRGMDTSGTDRTTNHYERLATDRAQVKMIQDLKINEHEKNRNFAGSREELLEEPTLMKEFNPDLKVRSAKNDNNVEGMGDKQNLGDTDLDKGDNTDDDLERKKTQRKSMTDGLVADKNTINVYENVLNELMQRKEGEESGERLDTQGKITTISKRYGRVMSDSDFDNRKKTQRKSMTDGLAADKNTINVYENVLNELMQRKEGQESGERSHTQGKTTNISKRYGRVMSDSDFDNTFGLPLEDAARSVKESAREAIETSREAVLNVEGIGTRAVSQEVKTVSGQDGVDNKIVRKTATGVSHVASNIMMQQSIDVYDNVMFPENESPFQEKSVRLVKGYREDQTISMGARAENETRSSFSSVVSDGAADVYNQVRRQHGRARWNNSTPQLSATEKPGQISSNRTSSYPYLPGSESDIGVQYTSTKAISASSFQSDSVCWGNYARIDDVQDKRSYDTESSTSGLVIPGAGRESTLSDVSDGYIFGEYATVKDDLSGIKVLRPLDGQNHQRNAAFQFKHFPGVMEDSHYQNISVITAQPTSSRYKIIPSHLDVHEDMAPGFENYAIIGQPMESKSVQFSAPSSPVGVIKVHCASQTSSESLAGLVRNDASDILEGLPVFEFTLGATQSTQSLYCDSADASPVTRCPDNRQPDITIQTASLDRRKFKPSGGPHLQKNLQKKKPTKVTFSRDEVLTQVINGIKEFEEAEPDGRGVKPLTTSTWSTFGGGIREFARILHVPFQCCRSGKRRKPKGKLVAVGLPTEVAEATRGDDSSVFDASSRQSHSSSVTHFDCTTFAALIGVSSASNLSIIKVPLAKFVGTFVTGSVSYR